MRIFDLCYIIPLFTYLRHHVNIHLDCVTLHFSEFPLVLEGGAGAPELLGELLGVGLEPHAPQLLLHLANLKR